MVTIIQSLFWGLVTPGCLSPFISRHEIKSTGEWCRCMSTAVTIKTLPFPFLPTKVACGSEIHMQIRDQNLVMKNLIMIRTRVGNPNPQVLAGSENENYTKKFWFRIHTLFKLKKIIVKNSRSNTWTVCRIRIGFMQIRIRIQHFCWMRIRIQIRIQIRIRILRVEFKVF
jgi:hypothetical protein